MTEGKSSSDTIITDIVANDISIALEKLSILSDKSSSNDAPNKESENISNDTIDIFKPLIILAIKTIRGKVSAQTLMQFTAISPSQRPQM